MAANDSVFILINTPVFETTVQLFRNGRWIEDYSIDPLVGRIVLHTTEPDSSQHICTYSYLSPALPLTVGPRYLTLPLLTELTREPDVISILPQQPMAAASRDELYTAGSIYRSVELSPFGGTDFSGGLRLQLQGRLTDDIQVSGVLADQSLPIQPEGNTQTLEEIDQVYLTVKHPTWNVTAGDINFTLNSGKFLKIDRKLVGLKGALAQPGSHGEAVYSASKGNYRSMTFKGTEGSQGPYLLASETGSRDIIVIAGSERVYVDGNRLIRGENNDYIIDYSTGEIYFTAQRLIHSDSDILVEFQYSDFRYNRNLVGASWKMQPIERGEVTIAYLNEYDNISAGSLNLSTAVQDSMAQAGDRDVCISGAVVDSAGDYYVNNGFYIYWTIDPPDSAVQRYSVTFQNDVANGAYIRKVTDTGQLYYSYVPENERQLYQDLYSPIQLLDRPEKQQVIQLSATYRSSEKFVIDTEISMSDYDINRLSNRNDDDNLGWAYNIKLAGAELILLPGWNFNYHLVNWGRGKQYKALQRERTARFDRDWNINSDQIGKENMLTAGFGFKRNTTFDLNMDWSHYQVQDRYKNRFLATTAGSTDWIPLYSGRISRMESPGEFLVQSTAKIQVLPGWIHPYYEYNGELNRSVTSFEHHTSGLELAGKTGRGSLGIGQRIDRAEIDTSNSGLERISRGYFGSMDLDGRSGSGWNYRLIFRKRIKTEFTEDREFDFELLQTNLSFNNRMQPLRWDMKVKLEETYTESRSTVYDSVGIGLGNYRYDRQFNEYIADPNGGFIAYQVLIGDRHPTTRFDGIQRAQIDFSKTRMKQLKGVTVRLEMRSEYRGSRFNTIRFLKPNLNDLGITRAQWNLYGEFDYRPFRIGRRFRAWNRSIRDLNGLDPRGGDLRRDQEIGLEVNETLMDGFLGIFKWHLKELTVNSAFVNQRNRVVSGDWLEGGLKWHPNQDWQCESTIQLGHSSVDHHEQNYRANAYGIKLDVLRFIGPRGRLQSRLEWFQVGTGGLTALPPEALNGLAVGRSTKLNLTGQFLLGGNLSINISGNYIADNRYNNLFTFTGEVRAFF